jgi:hypothetical protein
MKRPGASADSIRRSIWVVRLRGAIVIAIFASRPPLR